MPEKKKQTYLNENPKVGKRPRTAALRWLLTRKFPPRRMKMSAVAPSDYPEIACPPGAVRIFFIGHSTLLIEFENKRILTDPVFSKTCSPVQGSGPRRFSPPGIPFEQLPKIDAVLISHNHYDHLDHPTILRLGSDPHYVVPTGLSPWFKRRRCHTVTELDWWNAVELDGMRITATPAQHWSKRSVHDTNATHWCSFVVEVGNFRFFFAGDSGYYEGFKRIGEKLGPFHVAALPIGAYDPVGFMGEVHMTPEEAVRAYEDLRADEFVAIHHSTFQLTDEPPEEPPQRLNAEWKKCKYPAQKLWIPKAGEYLIAGVNE